LGSINFTLTAKNRFGSYQKVFEVEINEMVVAPAIEDFKIKFLETTSDSVLVSWNVSNKIATFPGDFDFEFKIVPPEECGAEKPKQISNLPARNNQTPIVNYKEILKLDFAHTWYDIFIRMKVSSAKNVEKMWSGWTKKQLKSGRRQPDYPPLTNPGAFSVLPNGDVYIYWKSLSKCHYNGEHFNYIITSNIKNYEEPNEMTLKYAIYRSHQINANRDTEIRIRSKNDIGSSVNSSLLIIPAKNRILPGPKIKKISNNGTYILSWSPPEFSPEEIISYTVFWCTSKTELINRCESDIDFKEFPANETVFEFKSDQTVNFAISANSKTSTSGMIWAKCTTANVNEIGKIKYIWIPKLTSREIEIAWKLECTDSGIVAGYEIEYCPVKQPKTLECKEPEEKRNLTTSLEDTKYTLTNLRPYTIYKIIIRMFSNSTMGPASEPMSNTTLEDGKLF
jgi:Fibronectin type III domain